MCKQKDQTGFPGNRRGSGSNAGTDMGTLSLAQWLIYKI